MSTDPLSALADAIHRLAAAIEQHQYPVARSVGPLTHYGPQPDHPKQEQSNDRKNQIRRVRPARG